MNEDMKAFYEFLLDLYADQVLEAKHLRNFVRLILKSTGITQEEIQRLFGKDE